MTGARQAAGGFFLSISRKLYNCPNMFSDGEIAPESLIEPPPAFGPGFRRPPQGNWRLGQSRRNHHCVFGESHPPTTLPNERHFTRAHALRKVREADESNAAEESETPDQHRVRQSWKQLEAGGQQFAKDLHDGRLWKFARDVVDDPEEVLSPPDIEKLLETF